MAQVMIKRLDTVCDAEERMALMLGEKDRYSMCFQKDADQTWIWDGSRWNQFASTAGQIFCPGKERCYYGTVESDK